MTAPTRPLVVGIDCGTQSAKVAIYDLTGRQVAQGRQPLRPLDRERPGWAVHPDDDIWTSIATACRSAMENLDADAGTIHAVGICPIRCCKAFLDRNGALIEPVMNWMDERAYQPYIPSSVDVAYATTLSGYAAHRFTGEFRDTAANYIEGQWPIDTDRWDWSDDDTTLADFKLRREQLFALQQPGEVIGALTADASQATGLPKGVAVVATANDKAVEMLGAGSWRGRCRPCLRQ